MTVESAAIVAKLWAETTASAVLSGGAMIALQGTITEDTGLSIAIVVALLGGTLVATVRVVRMFDNLVYRLRRQDERLKEIERRIGLADHKDKDESEDDV